MVKPLKDGIAFLIIAETPAKVCSYVGGLTPLVDTKVSIEDCLIG